MEKLLTEQYVKGTYFYGIASSTKGGGKVFGVLITVGDSPEQEFVVRTNTNGSSSPIEAYRGSVLSEALEVYNKF